MKTKGIALANGMRPLEVSEYTLLALTVGLFPISWHIALWFMALFIVNAVVRTTSYRTWGNDHNRLVRWCYALLPLLFAIYLASMLYTDNATRGWHSLAQMASFVLMPLYFLLARPTFLTHKRSVWLGYLFAASTTAVSLVYIGLFVWRVVIHHEPLQLMFDDTTIVEHRIYFSMYTLFSLAFLYIANGKRMTDISKRTAIARTVLHLAAMVVLCAATLILSSRIGILCMGVMLLCALVDIVFVRKHWVAGIVLAVAVAVVALSNVGTMKLVAFRFANTVSSLRNPVQDDRFGIWKNTMMVIGDNPVLGVGVGDMMDELESNRQKHFSQYEGTAWEWTNRNPHNQYLDTWVSTGIAGLAALLAIVVLPLVAFFHMRPKRMLMPLFIFITASTFMVEAVLERQMGVLFFAVAYCLLLNEFKSNE